MKNNQSDENQFNQMVLVPQQMLEQVKINQEKILLALEELPNSSPTPAGMVANKYIPESTAKEMLGKGTTWFWQLRKSGKINYKKVGSKIFYAISDIEALIESSTPKSTQV